MSEHNTNLGKSVTGVVIRDGKVLLARHTYGAGAGRLIIPGGYIQNGEPPEAAVVREIMEETGVSVSPAGIIGIRFNMHDWYIAFRAEYLAGEARSDGDENSEVVWLSVEEALSCDDVPDLSKQLIRAAISENEMPPAEFASSEKWAPQSLYCFKNKEN